MAAIVLGLNPAQHEDMVKKYLTEMADAISQFALAKGINITLDYCKDLAWAGCFLTEAFKHLSATEQQRIKDRVSAEKDPYSRLSFMDSNGDEYHVNDGNPHKGHPCH